MLKIIGASIIFLTTSFSFFAQERAENLNQLYHETVQIAGTMEQMDKRALVLLSLYYESNQQFPMAYAVSHLTLAIERSTNAPRIEKTFKAVFMKSYADAWSKWGDTLKLINRDMVRRVYFAFHATKLIQKGKVKRARLEQGPWASWVDDSRELYPVFEQIHLANRDDQQLKREQKRSHMKAFVDWEHREFIQPRMQEQFDELPYGLQLILQNTPSRFVEPAIFAVFKARTTYSIGCLADKKMRTKNFMNPDHRVKQARDFYTLLEEIKFDPYLSCFKGTLKNDRFEGEPYYISRFPQEFYKEPKAFTLKYLDVLRVKNTDLSDKAWLYRQYQHIPLKEFAAIPSDTVPLERKDKIELSINRDPVKRNQYINKAYWEIAEQLKACINPNLEIGNWYHFAHWASASALRVINESLFDDLSRIDKVGLKIGEMMDWVHQKEQINIFARANTLIAIEMIPLGRLFIKTYCQSEDHSRDIQAFLNFFRPQYQSDHFVQMAFEMYLDAKKARSYKKKAELLSFAATTQVMGEQMRVNENIYASFNFETRQRLLRNYLKFIGTVNGALAIGPPPQEKIPLTKDIRTDHVHPLLEDIESPRYKIFLERKGIPVNLKNEATIPKTAVRDWSLLKGRLKFLIGMFRVYIGHPMLLNR
jgi:hypothetical protein